MVVKAINKGINKPTHYERGEEESPKRTQQAEVLKC